jgi:glycosyltransferase involved in cell wall biosynthesis
MGHALNNTIAMKILVLSTWFPYPLSQGSKIRAYYLIKGLAQRHEIAVVSFQDAQLEPEWLDHLRRMCGRVDVVPDHPFVYNRFKTAVGWLSPQPSAVLASRSSKMSRQVQQVVQDWKPECVFALTFVTAPYALAVSGVRKIVDIDNLMAPMLYEDYRRAQGSLRRARNWLAYEKFQNYERWLYHQFDLCLVVSERDRKAAIRLTHLRPNQVGVVSNGVDTSSIRITCDAPEPDTLIFNGAVTYAANYDAMDYFLREVFPLIRAEVPEAHLRITGSTKGVSINMLPSGGLVTFTGYLEDIHSAVSSSCVCVVPLRLGGGTRLKILEAMALGTPIVSTSKGAEGLDVEAGKHLLIADTPGEFAAQTVRVLREPLLRQALAKNAAQLVRDRYDWVKIGRHFCDLVENV